MSYFPMFIELEQASCLIVGGGQIAYRKVMVLKDFGAAITVVSPKISEEIKQNGQIICQERKFEETDLDKNRFVIVATDDKEFNHRIAELCHKRNLAVNVVDQIEDCDFIFGSYVKEGNVVAAISSGGKSPVITQYLKASIQKIMTKQIGKMADYLGALRPRVKDEIAAETERKKVYQELLKIGLETNEIPDEEETKAVIQKHQMINNKKED